MGCHEVKFIEKFRVGDNAGNNSETSFLGHLLTDTRGFDVLIDLGVADSKSTKPT